MSNICDIYAKGVKKSLKNYWPAWLPSTRYNLGDIGVLNGYYFEKVGSLGELDIPFQITEDTGASPIELVSESGVSFTLKLAGETNDTFENVPIASAGVKINFGSQGAFVVQCSATYEPEIAAPMALQKEIIKGYESGKWQSDWVVIVRMVTAPAATFLISQSISAGLELSAKADLTAGLPDLAKAELGFALRSQRGEIIKIIGAQEVTPFFQLGRLKRRLFGSPRFTTRSMRGPDQLTGGVAPNPKREQIDALYLDVLRDDEVEKG